MIKYQDGNNVQYGDVVIIGVNRNRFVTVEEDGITITYKDYINDGVNQKILVCGNDNFDGKFYLTFKYNKGFLKYDNNLLKSGVPWTEKTIFNIYLLKKAINSDNIFIHKKDI